MVEQVTLKSVYDFISSSDIKTNISVIRNTNEKIQWVLVFSLNNSQKEIGITQTNEFGIINQYGGISTYFKPENGLEYWLEQIAKYSFK